mmetsp:Transcript_40088/g.43504  ORF Transcript_40088/g.43504 Transcript_40088/m.43504 type:complete len:182 (+) Transcript_40088:3731-4276(+)
MVWFSPTTSFNNCLLDSHFYRSLSVYGERLLCSKAFLCSKITCSSNHLHSIDATAVACIGVTCNEAKGLSLSWVLCLAGSHAPQVGLSVNHPQTSTHACWGPHNSSPMHWLCDNCTCHKTHMEKACCAVCGQTLNQWEDKDTAVAFVASPGEHARQVSADEAIEFFQFKCIGCDVVASVNP